MIALLVTAAYIAANLYAARAIYGHLRAHAIDKRAEKEASRPADFREDPVQHFNEWDRVETIGGAILAAVFWPVALLGWGVIRFVTHDPPQSRAEMAARIRELETKLGIDTTKRTDR
jgi:hypothetical protein